VWVHCGPGTAAPLCRWHIEKVLNALGGGSGRRRLVMERKAWNYAKMSGLWYLWTCPQGRRVHQASVWIKQNHVSPAYNRPPLNPQPTTGTSNVRSWPPSSKHEVSRHFLGRILHARYHSSACMITNFVRSCSYSSSCQWYGLPKLWEQCWCSQKYCRVALLVCGSRCRRAGGR